MTIIKTDAGARRYLVGRTIVAVELHPFETGRYKHASTTHDPVLVLDDGSRIRFVVDETEGGEYGVRFIRVRRARGGER